MTQQEAYREAVFNRKAVSHKYYLEGEFVFFHHEIGWMDENLQIMTGEYWLERLKRDEFKDGWKSFDLPENTKLQLEKRLSCTHG